VQLPEEERKAAPNNVDSSKQLVGGTREFTIGGGHDSGILLRLILSKAGLTGRSRAHVENHHNDYFHIPCPFRRIRGANCRGKLGPRKLCYPQKGAEKGGPGLNHAKKENKSTTQKTVCRIMEQNLEDSREFIHPPTTSYLTSDQIGETKGKKP